MILSFTKYKIVYHYWYGMRIILLYFGWVTKGTSSWSNGSIRLLHWFALTTWLTTCKTQQLTWYDCFTWSSISKINGHFSRDASTAPCSSKISTLGPQSTCTLDSSRSWTTPTSSREANTKSRRESTLISYLRTLALIKPDAYMHMGKIINMIE